MEKIGRTKIVDLLKREDIGAMVNVKGWVRTRRGSKQVNFIALNDGSTINNVQIVVDVDKLGDEFLKPITTGASISVNGILTQSQGKGQSVEIQATEIEIAAKHILRTKEKLNRMLAENTGRDYETICADTERDNWKSAEEACEYGLIDKVITFHEA
mgnify:CR=1 FL=1